MAATKEAGRYGGRLVEVNVGQSKNGTPQIELVFEVVQQFINESWVKIQPFKRFCNLYLSENSAEYSFEKLQKLEFKGRPSTARLEDFGEQVKKSIALDCYHEPKPESAGGGMSEVWQPSCWGGEAKSSVKNKLEDAKAAKADAMWENFLAKME